MLATLSLALTTFGDREELTEGSIGERSVIWFGAFLAFTNIFVAFGTMTNVSRYQIRNEEFRTEFLRKKLPKFELSLFRILSPSVRNQMTSNPFVKKLQASFDDFTASAKYYDTSCDEIEGLYKAMGVESVKSVENFMEQIITYFIPDLYQKQVYLKDSLLKVYLAAEELVELLLVTEKQANSNVEEQKVVSILERLPGFTSREEETLQTGPIKYGFWRAGRGLSQSVFVTPARYRLLSLSNKLASCGCIMSTTARIKVCTRCIIWHCFAQSCCYSFTKCTSLQFMHITLTDFNEYVGRNRLRCEVQDMKEFFHASMESAHASAVYAVACLSFSLALLTTVMNIILAVVPQVDGIADGEKFKFPDWLDDPFLTIQDVSTLANSYVSFVALEYFVKLFYHQRKVVRAVNKRYHSMSQTVNKLGRIARFQSYVSILSSIGALGAMLVLISGLLERRVDAIFLFENEQIVQAALGVLGIWFIAGLGTFYIDFFLLWNFGPTAGRDLCSQFKTKITDIYNKYAQSNDDEHLIKDYTAREFLLRSRFDSVVGADRFSAIMHTVLSDDFLDEESSPHKLT